MASFLYNLGTIAIYVFILASMLLTGLMVTFGDLVAPLHNRRLLGVSLFANFLVVPLIAVTLIILIPMNPELAAGLLLVSTAALVVIFASFTDMANDVLLMVLMVTIFAIIIVSILVGIIFRKRMDAEKKAKGSGA